MSNESLMKIDKYCSECHDLILGLDKWKPYINVRKQHDIIEEIDGFLKSAQVKSKEGRLLTIGIVGQIKAGKSSFINALLFNGKDLLPKAATPMTSALTVISWGETPKAKINYYNNQDWEHLQKKAAEYDAIFNKAKQELRADNSTYSELDIELYCNMPETLIHAKQMVHEAKERGIRVEDYLGKTKVIDATSPEDLVGLLSKYVGAEGKYSPIVESCELEINIDVLKDIRIVDTPGLNDPLIVRGRKTRQFLGQCDVLFFVSYVNRFLDASDINLLVSQAPSEGIARVIVIGSKFDTALISEIKDADPLQNAKLIKEKLNYRATEIIERELSNGNNQRFFGNLKANLPVEFVAAMAYNIVQNANNLNNEEKHVLSRLKSVYSGTQFTDDLLLKIANIETIETNRLIPVKKDKETLLENAISSLIEDKEKSFNYKWQEMREELLQRREQVENGSIADLEAGLNKVKNSIQGSSIKISTVFDDCRITTKKNLYEFRADISERADLLLSPEEQAATRTESYLVDKDGLFSPVARFFGSWFNQDWGKKKETRTVNYRFVVVQEVFENIEKFVREAEKELNRAIENTVNLPELRKQLYSIIESIVENANENTEIESLLLPVRQTIAEITLPTELSLDSEKYIENIQKQFSGDTVENENIPSLKNAIRKVIKQLLKELASEVKVKEEELETQYKLLKDSFQDKLLENMEKECELLTNQINDKKQSLAAYKEILTYMDCELPSL